MVITPLTVTVATRWLEEDQLKFPLPPWAWGEEPPGSMQSPAGLGKWQVGDEVPTAVLARDTSTLCPTYH